ncbi:MAG: SDR family NAD(P)-dependent oxidoreductase [Hyphomicrobiaceae bacterium]|nr:SDR family NAD(P)-dependent oxidoreductase [Hyphomicrobiaceae bacterium]
MAQRTVLITGCSSGIGLASARELKARNWRVFATARANADLERLTIEEGVEAIALELRDEASIAQCAATVLERCDGRLDALFNNAAYGQVGAMEDIPAALLREQIEVNVIGTHELTRRVIPAMRRAGSGRIVMCSSVLGLASAPYRGAYCASKFALEGLTDALRLELHGTGIKVSLIEPGPIATRFVATALTHFRDRIAIERSPHRETYLQRLKAMEAGGRATFKLEPQAVAAKLVHALESSRPRRRYYVTTLTYITAAARWLAPAALLDAILRRM